MRCINTNFYLAGCLVLLVSKGLHAADIQETSHWQLDAEAGAILTSGNTDSKSINTSVSVKYTTNSWLVGAKLNALNSQENKQTTKEKYTGRFNYNKNLNEDWYLSWVAQQERDRFSGYQHQTSNAINLGYKAINTPNYQLNLEAGPGYRWEKERQTQATHEEALARFAGQLNWQINTGVSLEQEYILESSNEKTIQNYEASFRTQINSRLAAKLSYKLKHDSQVPKNKTKTDTQTSLNLVYKF